MGLFSDHGTRHDCPDPDSAGDPAQVPIVGRLTLHHLMMIISGACMGFSCLVAFLLIFRHATHYSLPKEQRHIIRIVFILPVFAVISFLSVTFLPAAIYLKPVSDLYEAFVLASFFLLLCAYIQEDDDHRQTFLRTSGTMKNYITATIGAFQFPVVMLIVVIATAITQATGTYCTNSNRVYFAHIWLTIISAVSTFFAIMGVLRFYEATKPQTLARRPLPKLVAFKGIIFLEFIQVTVFSFLASSGDLDATSKHTYNDLAFGLPNLLTSIEIALFAIIFLYVYRVSPYSIRSGAEAVPLGHGGYMGGLLGIKAYGQALNISDILHGIISVPRLLGERRNGRDNVGQEPTYQQYYNNAQMNDVQNPTEDASYKPLQRPGS